MRLLVLLATLTVGCGRFHDVPRDAGTSCSGCFQDGVCTAGAADDACGYGAMQCRPCSGLRRCQGQQCTIDVDSEWDIIVESVTVLGSDWDLFGDPPDPFVVFESPHGVRLGSTTIASNSNAAEYHQLIMSGVKAGLLTHPDTYHFRVIDSDGIDDDVVGDATLPLPLDIDHTPTQVLPCFDKNQHHADLTVRLVPSGGGASDGGTTD